MLYLKILSFSYLLGSIPFGLLIGKLFGKDVRLYGSKNIGFTNVLRVVGVFPAILVLILDALKGYVSVSYGYQMGGEVFAILGAVASILGHMFPLYLKFRGGKGVATAFGVIIFLAPKVTLVVILIWVIITATTRYVSLASICAALFLPFGMHFFNRPFIYIGFAVVLAVFIVIRHIENIKRIINKTENKIGSKSVE